MTNKEISKLKNEIEAGIEKRIAYANAVFKEDIISEAQLKEYENVLNLNGQNQMVTLQDFYDRNSDVPGKVIKDKMKELKCMHFYPFIANDGKKYIAGLPNPPYIDFSLIPFVDDNKIMLDENIVISKETERILQDCCNEFREQDKKNKLF